jgi:hypothetical protein
MQHVLNGEIDCADKTSGTTFSTSAAFVVNWCLRLRRTCWCVVNEYFAWSELSDELFLILKPCGL